MPKKGYKAITINEQAYLKLVDMAKALDKSIPETIIFLSEKLRGESSGSAKDSASS